MAYPTRRGEQNYHSSDLDDVQGYNDLRTIWKYVKLSEKGKTAPLTENARSKIVKGLKRTMSEGKSSRTRNTAAAMIAAMADGDWDRDVYRKPIKGIPRMARASRPKGQGSKGSGDGTGRGDAEGSDAGGGDGEIYGR
jgi:hypothetical protein